MNTPSELEEIDLLVRTRISAEETSLWYGALPDITSRGRQLRRLRLARQCGVAAATVGLVATGLFLNSPGHNPSEQTLAIELSAVPSADYGWTTNPLAPEEAEAAQIAQACRVIGTLQDGPAQALTKSEPIAISQHYEVATAIYLGANNFGFCQPDWIQGRWRGQADGSFVVHPIARPAKMSPTVPATIEFMQTTFTVSTDASTASTSSVTFGWAQPSVDRIQISVGGQRHEALVKDGYFLLELPPAHEGFDAVEKATADGTFTISELRDATLTAYDASGTKLGTIPFQVG